MNDITKPKMIVIENILKGLIVFKTVSCEYGDSIPVSIECLVREAPICKDKYDYYLYLYFSVGKYTESIGGGPIEGLFKGQTDTEEADQIIMSFVKKYIIFWEKNIVEKIIRNMSVDDYIELMGQIKYLSNIQCNQEIYNNDEEKYLEELFSLSVENSDDHGYNEKYDDQIITI